MGIFRLLLITIIFSGCATYQNSYKTQLDNALKSGQITYDQYLTRLNESKSRELAQKHANAEAMQRFSQSFQQSSQQAIQQANYERQLREQRTFEMQKAAFEHSQRNRTINTNCRADGFGGFHCTSN